MYVHWCSTKVSHVSSKRQWWISERLLSQQSSVFWSNEQVLKEEQSADVFELFVQGLYTWKYKKRPVRAFAFDATPTGGNSLSLTRDSRVNSTMDWSIEAAVLAWEIERRLGSPMFQNDAMERLFAAFSRP
jgi:hypothetical protein